MARAFQSEAIRGNMAESLARRPAIAIGSGSTPDTGQFQGRAKLTGACVIEIGRLVADPDQPRKTFPDESIEQLAASIRLRGQMQPIMVRWSPEIDRYTIVDGERRFRAAERAGVASLSALDVTGKSPTEILKMQLVINALREDVPAVEQARSWRKLMDDEGLSHRELAEELGYDHATITRSLALLNLPESIQADVDAGEIRPQTGYELSRIEDPAEQAFLADEAKAGRLKRDDLRQRVKESRPSSTASKPKGRGAKNAAAGPTLVDERIIRTSANKLVVTGLKGKSFDLPTLLASLKEAVATIEAEIGAGRGGEADAA